MKKLVIIGALVPTMLIASNEAVLNAERDVILARINENSENVERLYQELVRRNALQWSPVPGPDFQNLAPESQAAVTRSMAAGLTFEEKREDFFYELMMRARQIERDGGVRRSVRHLFHEGHDRNNETWFLDLGREYNDCVIEYCHMPEDIEHWELAISTEDDLYIGNDGTEITVVRFLSFHREFIPQNKVRQTDLMLSTVAQDLSWRDGANIETHQSLFFNIHIGSTETNLAHERREHRAFVDGRGEVSHHPDREMETLTAIHSRLFYKTITRNIQFIGAAR